MKQILSFIAGLILGFMIGFGSNYQQTIKRKPIVIPRDTVIIDSISHIIDTVEVDKIVIKSVYEKKKSFFYEQSVIDDYKFFNDYLRSRFDIYNSDTTKTE